MKKLKFLKMLALVVLTFAAISCSSSDDPYYPPDGGGNGGGNPPKSDGMIHWTYKISFRYLSTLGSMSDYLIAFEMPRTDAFEHIQSKEELSTIDRETRANLIRNNMYLEIHVVTNYGDTLIINTADFDILLYDVKDRRESLLYLITIEEWGGQTPSDPTAGGSDSPAVKAEKVTVEGYWISQKTGDEIPFARDPDPEMSYR